MHCFRNWLAFCSVMMSVGTSGWAWTEETDVDLGRFEQREIDAFIARDQPEYGWKLEGRESTQGLTRLALTLTSQRWQDSTWRHKVRIFRPDESPATDAAIIFVNGGSTRHTPGIEIDMPCIALANLSGLPVIALFQVPNQPLLGERYEDALIAKTWRNFLETEDPNWPLLFPMVNSVVKAMDCVDEVSRQEFQQPVKRFIVTGASKRGWTSWLTAAADARVIGTAPMVIDTLNFQTQMRYQKATWGAFSEQIDDYTRAGLVNIGDESLRETRLREMMDPYVYRERLTAAKLIINGTNDRYWRVDALKNYWSDLSGPKNVLTVPNAGHSLEGGQLQVVATLAAFARATVAGERLPHVEWDHQMDAKQRRLTFRVRVDRPASATRFWVAFSATRDFRDAEWNAREADWKDSTESRITVDVPERQQIALFGDVTIGPFLRDYHLSTGVVQPEFQVVE